MIVFYILAEIILSMFFGSLILGAFIDYDFLSLVLEDYILFTLTGFFAYYLIYFVIISVIRKY